MFAVSINIHDMPDSEFADNEASVNAAIPEVLDPQSKTFKFYLTFNATFSNNVEIAFGQAVDISLNTPNLTHEETDLIVGWDCGRWFLRPKGLKKFYYSSVTNFTAGERTLSGFLKVDSEDNLYSMNFKDGGENFAFDGVTVSNSVEWLKPTEWNLLKVVTRGDNTDAEDIRVSFTGDKTVIILKMATAVFRFKANGHWMGQCLELPGFRSERVYSLRCVSSDFPVMQIEWIRNGRCARIWRPEGSSSFDFSVEWCDTSMVCGREYSYVRILRADGHTAWSSPIFLRA